MSGDGESTCHVHCSAFCPRDPAPLLQFFSKGREQALGALGIRLQMFDLGHSGRPSYRQRRNEARKLKKSTRTSLQHEISLSTSIVWAFCASSSSFRIC